MEYFLYSELKTFWSVLVFILGASFGSFGNVLIYRLPRGLSISKPRSHCPHCEEPIAYYDNIPILSFIILRGKCRYCQESISIQYPLVEALTGIIFWGILQKFAFTLDALYYASLAFILIVQAFIDFKHLILIDELNLAGGVIGLVFLFKFSKWEILDKGIGIVLGAGILLIMYLLVLLLFKTEGVGIGDIKTVGMIGLYLGVTQLIVMFLIACTVGLVWGIIKMLSGKGRLIPFGTMMAIGSIVVIFWGEAIISWWYY